MDTDNQFAEARQALNDAENFEVSRSLVDEGALKQGASNEGEEATEGKGVISVDEHFLTPGMWRFVVRPMANRFHEGWAKHKRAFSSAVGPYRNKMDSLKRIHGEIEELEREKESMDQLTQSEFADNIQWSKNKDEYEDAKQRYNIEKKKQGGRSTNQWPLWLYLATLLVVGSLEVPINFTTLLAYLGLPGFAAGSVGLILLIFMFAAHEHGSVLKQHKHFFGAHVTASDKRWKLIFVLVAFFFLVLALGFVGWARYVMVINSIPSVSAQALLTEDVAGPSIPLTVGISLFANLMVYGIGVFLAYFRHDPSPPLVQAEAAANKKGRLHKKTEDKRIAVRDQRMADLQKQIEERQNTANHDYAEVTELVQMENSLQDHEKELVVSLARRVNNRLMEYQQELTSVCQSFTQGAEFVCTSSEHRAPMSARSYATTTLEVPRDALA